MMFPIIYNSLVTAAVPVKQGLKLNQKGRFDNFWLGTRWVSQRWVFLPKPQETKLTGKEEEIKDLLKKKVSVSAIDRILGVHGV